MPHLNHPAPGPDGSAAYRATWYRRALFRSDHWLAVELAGGLLRVLANPMTMIGRAQRDRERCGVDLGAEASALFRQRMHAARHLDLRQGGGANGRCEQLCRLTVENQ